MTSRMTALEHAFPHRTQPLLMTGLVAGDPYLEATGRYMRVCVEAGADAIELVMPFSDPLFHGPVLRRACQRAMAEKVGWDDLGRTIKDFRSHDDTTPVVVTSYANRLLARGQHRCIKGLAAAGADGLMVVDLPGEEAREISSLAQEQDLALIQAVAPTTGLARFRQIASQAQGLLMWTGHCGMEIDLDPQELREQIHRFRQHTSLPLVVSHNVESGAEAAQIVGAAQGVLVSSALTWLIEGGGPDVEHRLARFVSELRHKMDEAVDA